MNLFINQKETRRKQTYGLPKGKGSKGNNWEIGTK